MKSMTSYTPPAYPWATPCFTCSDPVAQAGAPAAAEEDAGVTAGVLPLPDTAPEAGAAGAEADAGPAEGGWLLDDAHPATVAAQASAATATASPALG